MSLYSEMNADFKRMVAHSALDEDSKITLLTLADDMQKEHDQSVEDQFWLTKQQ